VTSCTLPEAPALFESVAEEGTLDELITSVWEGLRAHATVECPVCHGEMAPEYGVHARAVGGRCSACGSTLR
jgi:hypothetical protein